MKKFGLTLATIVAAAAMLALLAPGTTSEAAPGDDVLVDVIIRVRVRVFVVMLACEFSTPTRPLSLGSGLRLVIAPKEKADFPGHVLSWKTVSTAPAAHLEIGQAEVSALVLLVNRLPDVFCELHVSGGSRRLGARCGATQQGLNGQVSHLRLQPLCDLGRNLLSFFQALNAGVALPLVIRDLGLR